MSLGLARSYLRTFPESNRISVYKHIIPGGSGHSSEFIALGRFIINLNDALTNNWLSALWDEKHHTL